MKELYKKSWIVAIYFLLFESLYWIKGKDILLAMQYFISDGTPLVSSPDKTGVFHSYIGLFISMAFLALSAWCMKQFVKNFVMEIRSNGIKGKQQ